MNIRPFSRVQILVVLIFVVFGTLFHSRGSTPIAGLEQDKISAPPDEEKLKRELEEIGKRLIQVITRGDPQALVPLCSRKGVAFGVDQPEISLREIQGQIREKRGTYCMFFDTDCLKKQDGFQNYFSYRQLLSESHEQQIKTHLIRDRKVLAGEVRVFLKGGPIEKTPDMNPIEFQFTREQGKWKLRAVTY